MFLIYIGPSSLDSRRGCEPLFGEPHHETSGIHGFVIDSWTGLVMHRLSHHLSETEVPPIRHLPVYFDLYMVFFQRFLVFNTIPVVIVVRDYKDPEQETSYTILTRRDGETSIDIGTLNEPITLHSSLHVVKIRLRNSWLC